MSQSIPPLPLKDISFEDVVPHAKPMALLDNIIEWDTLSNTHSLTADVTIRPDSMFCQNNAVPSWVGMEYMAQAIAALAGIRAREAGEPVKIGFLVGTRRFTCDCPQFEVGTRLRVYIEEELQGDNGLGVFACTLSSDESDSLAPKTLARANLNVYLPSDAEEFLQQTS